MIHIFRMKYECLYWIHIDIKQRKDKVPTQKSIDFLVGWLEFQYLYTILDILSNDLLTKNLEFLIEEGAFSSQTPNMFATHWNQSNESDCLKFITV